MSLNSVRVVECLHRSIDSFAHLEQDIDANLSPHNYHNADDVETTKARFAGELKKLNEQISSDGQSLFTALDHLIHSSKTPITEQLIDRRMNLKALSERIVIKIDKYTTTFAKTEEINKLLRAIQDISIPHARIPEVLQLKERVTVLERQEQTSPRDFIKAQKDAILTMSCEVNDLYDDILRRKLTQLHNELTPRHSKYSLQDNSGTPETKTARLKETLKQLPLNICGAIYGQVYALSSGDRSGANWGEAHACDNLDILKKAVCAVIKQETPDLAKEISDWSSEEKKSENKDDEENTPILLQLTAQQQSLSTFAVRITELKTTWEPELLSDKNLVNDAVRELLDPLEDSIRGQIYKLVWEKAGKPQGNPNFGMENVGHDLERLESIFQDVYLGTIAEGPQKETIKEMFQQAAKQAAAVAALEK